MQQWAHEPEEISLQSIENQLRQLSPQEREEDLKQIEASIKNGELTTDKEIQKRLQNGLFKIRCDLTLFDQLASTQQDEKKEYQVLVDFYRCLATNHLEDKPSLGSQPEFLDGHPIRTRYDHIRQSQALLEEMKTQPSKRTPENIYRLLQDDPDFIPPAWLQADVERELNNAPPLLLEMRQLNQINLRLLSIKYYSKVFQWKEQVIMEAVKEQTEKAKAVIHQLTEQLAALQSQITKRQNEIQQLQAKQVKLQSEIELLTRLRTQVKAIQAIVS